MENLNAEQVIKALECCIDRPKCIDCPNLTLCAGHGFEYLLVKAVELIKELTKENASLHSSCTDLTRKCASLTEENERVKENNVFLNDTIGKNAQQALEVTLEEIEKTKVNNVREIQDRLQAFFGTYVLGYKIPITEALKAVNQILKEVLESSNERP